jgi:L-alanine-DL-glutamate epimerase-like enolase superfamily enzyme
MIDIACWDLRSQKYDQPIWQMLGGDPDVAVSWTVTRQPPAVMADEAVRMIERHGFSILKIKGGQGREVDRAAITAIRDAIGAAPTIYVDANRRYPAEEGLDYIKELADLGAIVAEDPCAFLPDQAFRTLQDQSPIPLLVDSGCRSLDDARLFIEHGAQAVSVKLSSMGITDGLRLAELAHEHGVAAHVGFIGESSLGALAALQLASSLPNRERILPAETTFFLTFGDEYVVERVTVRDGKVHLPEQPGLERWIDWERVAALAP